jgi:hypothetical protein
MNANTNTNTNAKSTVSDGYVVRERMGIKDSQNDTGNWKNKIPEGNWRTPPPTPPTMQSATAWSYKTSMKGVSTTTTPPPSQKTTAWSNNRRKIINTPQTPQAPIKKKEFVYDMGEFPSLNPSQVVGITNTNTNILSYANVASIPPPPPQKIIPRNLNDDFAIEINENEQNYYNEEEEFTEYKTRESRRWDYDNNDVDNNDVYEDDFEMDLESGTRYSYN